MHRIALIALVLPLLVGCGKAVPKRDARLPEEKAADALEFKLDAAYETEERRCLAIARLRSLRVGHTAAIKLLHAKYGVR